MKEKEDTSVRDALSQCGLFAAAEVEELAAEAAREGKPAPAAASGASPAATNGTVSMGGSILDELDRVLPQESPPSRDSRPASPPPPPSRTQAPPPPPPSPMHRVAAAPLPRHAPEPPAAASRAPAQTSGLEDLLERALEMRARTLHLDAEDGTLRARARVGMERPEVGAARASEVERILRSALKLSNDAAIPPSSEVTLEIGGRARAIIVSTLQTPRGTRYAFGGLEDDRTLRVDALGIEPEPLEELKEALARATGGLVLLAAPRGHGASSTLRAAASERARAGKLVVTLDGPSDPSTGVLAVRPEPGSRGRMEALAHAMRHDPDVLIAGRVSTGDEASAAMQAAAEGRLVLASIHARSAADAATVARGLGVDPFLLAATQPLLLGQRLARALCTACRERENAAAAQLRAFGFEEDEVDAASLYRAVGCARCTSGYRDRFLLMETVPANKSVFDAIREGAHGEALEKRLPKDRLSLRGCAIRAAARGRTTIDEAARAIAG